MAPMKQAQAVRERWSEILATAGLFMACAAAFALLSWRVTAEVRQYSPEPQYFEELTHVGVGAVIGWLAGGRRLAGLGILLSIGIDADHLGAVLGLPTLPRGSHSAIFIALVCSLFWMLGTARVLRVAPALLLAVLVGAECLNHIGVDALVGQGDFPIYAPISWKFITFDRVQGAMLLTGAVGLALWGRLWSRREERATKGTSD